MSTSDNKDDVFKYLLTSKKSWLSEENWSPLYSSLVGTYSEVSRKQTIKIEERSNLGDTEKLSQSNLNKNAGSTFGLIKVHEGRIMYECEYCHKCYLDKSGILRHRRYHTGEKPFKCDLCGKSFVEKYECDHHLRSSHLDERKIKCEVCQKSVVIKWELTKGKKSVQCVVCKKILTSKQSFKRHIYTHKIDAPFKCEICRKSFQLTSEVDSLTHSVGGPIKCDICEKSFAENYIEKHILTHTHKGEKPFKCETCGKLFAYKHSHKRHMLAHTMTFKCDVCGKCFAAKHSLIDHSNIHSGIKPYTCDVCNKSFTHNNTYNKHRKSHPGFLSKETSSTCNDPMEDQNT